MAVHTPLKVDHEVLGEDFCSGYMDPFGNWNTGFPCPHLGEDVPGLCCGVENLKYCCNGRGPTRHIVNNGTHLPLLMGVVFGVSVAIIVSVVICFFKCFCCLLYKKRQCPISPLYHLHCPSSTSGGGVANMYSFSNEPTPQDTPRSSTRSSHRGVNNRWSTTTADSGPGLLNLDHHLALLEDATACPATAHASFRPHNLDEGCLRNIGSGGRLPSSTALDRAIAGNYVGSLPEDQDLPPPYNSNDSTLMAVRTNQVHQGQFAQQAATSDVSNNSRNNNSNSSRVSNMANGDPNNDSPPPPPIPSSTHSSNSHLHGFPTFHHQQLHHQQHQQHQQYQQHQQHQQPQQQQQSFSSRVYILECAQHFSSYYK
ncbi:unnamed protein product, partial [Meganyctiphanes norvegica]